MAEGFTSSDPAVQDILDTLTNPAGFEMSEPVPTKDGFSFTLTPIRESGEVDQP